MLSLAVVEEIAFHLDAGQLTQREIARRLRVGRATVSAIAQGRRGIYGRVANPEPPKPEMPAPAVRCPQCGYLVHLPCLVCRAREYCRARRILAQLASRRPAAPANLPRRPLPLGRSPRRGRAA